MKTYFFTFLAFVSILISQSTLDAQNLPDEWNISDDGRMMTAGGENESGFYGQFVLNEVQLEFVESNWWQLLETNYASGTDLLATCWINGEQYDSVGVRFKGETSYRRNNTDKKSFNITLDYMIDGQDIEGYNTFNLNCGWEDNSSMREVLFNNIGHNYYMGLKSNFVNLSINGNNWGPYQSVQQFDSDYIKEWYLSNDGTIWRARRTDADNGGGGGPGGGGPPGMGGGGNFGTGSSTLNYNGADSTDYNTDYTLKRTEQDDPWAGLIAACDVLNNEPLATLEDKLSEVLDIDKACWFLAHEVVFSDDDSYINKGGSDYYVYYEAETGRIIPMEYDGNSVLGDNNLNYDLFIKENDNDFPLMNRMLQVPSIRQRYLSHVRVILEDYFTPEIANAKIDTWKDLIDQLVQDDPKKFYTYNQFLNEITSLKQTVVTRRNFLMNDSEMNNVQPLIVEEVSYSVDDVQWQKPNGTDEVDVVTNVVGQAGVAAVWLYYGEGFTGAFSKTEMFDDGMHNDGAANDGQYGGTIPPMTAGNYVRYYIEAIADDNAGTKTYEPKGAEHDIFIYQVGLLSVVEMPVVINELMAANDTAVADELGEFDDWVELYNVSGSSIDLSGWMLTDDINELDKYTFPDGTTLASDNYLVVWADSDEEQGDFHAGFKLSADGETLYLINSALELVDEISFPETEPDLSYARIPNGTGPFEYKQHTFGFNNEQETSVYDAVVEMGLLVYPNPAFDFFTVDASATPFGISDIQIFNVNGQLVYSMDDITSNKCVIPLSDFSAGMYFAKVKVDDLVVLKKIYKM